MRCCPVRGGIISKWGGVWAIVCVGSVIYEGVFPGLGVLRIGNYALYVHMHYALRRAHVRCVRGSGLVLLWIVSSVWLRCLPDDFNVKVIFLLFVLRLSQCLRP